MGEGGAGLGFLCGFFPVLWPRKTESQRSLTTAAEGAKLSFPVLGLPGFISVVHARLLLFPDAVFDGVGLNFVIFLHLWTSSIAAVKLLMGATAPRRVPCLKPLALPTRTSVSR